PTLLVTGGSQGASRLNKAVSGAAQALADAGVQVLHVQGKHGGAEPVSTSVPYVVLDYVDRMDLAYAAADLVLCRAGASSVTEAAATGLPAILVPLPIGNGEQELNARPVVDAGGALLVDDATVSPEWVAASVAGLVTDPARLQQMGTAAAALIPRDADERLARIVLECARQAHR
ncbi:MAG: UDP-N-acetylglucosamine--N-acetylmuramyl-(pentapeptide) pyrophosphoryl-undecaprenol, partial [Nocardioides sp.]|nr:UDP-N-acetylglucosamine--N-acetylmuramyl-(pentapeptide) pyrophosphoryl-undecaprenol [Nocardioides sp.]